MMDHTERARAIMLDNPPESGRERWPPFPIATLAAAFREVERETLERVAQAIEAAQGDVLSTLERAASLIEESPRNPLGAARRIRALGETS